MRTFGPGPLPEGWHVGGQPFRWRGKTWWLWGDGIWFSGVEPKRRRLRRWRRR